LKTNWKTGFSYWFIHFTVETVCFFTIYYVFGGIKEWFLFALAYDILAFAPQSVIGSLLEKHPNFRPGLTGMALLALGSALLLFGAGNIVSYNSPKEYFDPFHIFIIISGLILLTMGNCIIHLLGAFITLRVSEGRLSESAVFVGGGSFGVITGKLLSGVSCGVYFPFIFIIIATLLILKTDNNIIKSFGKDTFNFSLYPCRHNICSDKSPSVIIFVLLFIVIVRAYIGYGLPTAWNQTTVQNVFLYIFMGTGKMAGGILSDIFGAKRVGVFSCILSVPVLLLSDHIMWTSLIGVALFSMTMAVTLGGLVSVLPENPGIAFGITTIGLLIGSVSTFIGLPDRLICNILIAVMSFISAAGFIYCLKNNGGKKHAIYTV